MMEFTFADTPKALKAMASIFDKIDLPLGRSYCATYFTPYGGCIAGYVHYYYQDAKEVEEARKLNDLTIKEILERFDSATPNAVGRVFRSHFLKKLKPNCAGYLRKIKKMFDPNGIMNPGTGLL